MPAVAATLVKNKELVEISLTTILRNFYYSLHRPSSAIPSEILCLGSD